MDHEDEAKDLERLALNVQLYLIAFSVIAFFAGYALFLQGSGSMTVVATALMGISGSGVAALTSCLDRYANGFELESGEKVPPADGKAKETFNKRLARWFIFRPFLGLLVAPVFIWGIEYFAGDSARYTNSVARLAFWSFVGGLLAKSVVDLIKRLFKNIFKA
jgi:hypothetical protein